AAFALDGMADTACGHVRDERAFNTVLCAPDVERLTDVWKEIVLVDGDLLPGEAAAIRERCPRAQLTQLRANGAVAALLQSLVMDDETLRRLYRRVRMPDAPSLRALAADTGLTEEQALTGLTAFSQVGLAELSLSPYALRLLPPVKCRMDDSPLVRYLRGMKQVK
ncbi:MAG: hypothetical protein ACI4ML_08185, partial [Aristaeellaceae bacterium]